MSGISGPGYIYILQNQISNITTDPVQLNFGSNTSSVMAWGTWDGAEVVLQTRTIPDTNDNVAWITIVDRFNIPFTFTEDTQITLTEYVYTQYVRAVVTNAGAGTDINLTIQAV